jgi:hypothetical protein
MTHVNLICPECGGQFYEGRSCQAIFDEFLTWEFEDAGYGAVHFLTVAVFMTQHGRYTEAAQAWMTEQLRAHLVNGEPVESICRRAQRTAGQDQRPWKVTRPIGAPPGPRRAWEMTIADVARAHDATLDASDYRAAVTDWARKTLRQLEANDTHSELKR